MLIVIIITRKLTFLQFLKQFPLVIGVVNVLVNMINMPHATMLMVKIKRARVPQLDFKNIPILIILTDLLDMINLI